MSSYYHFNAHSQQPTAIAAGPVSHSHHGPRNRRAPRLSVSQNSQRHYRGVRGMKELAEAANISSFRTKYEAGRSFDLEDDMEFCPGLLTESDLVSIHSASSERSSLASNSPAGSPTQMPKQVVSSFSLNSSSPPFVPPTFQSQYSSNMKLHQPAATRGRAVRIVDPITGNAIPSPPPSVSPGARMQHSIGRRW